MIEAVIFDVDGTLVDSNDLHAAAWQETFRRFGKDVPLAALRHQIGKGADQFMPVFWTEEELSRIGREMDDYRDELYRKRYMERAVPFPKVKQLMERIRQDRKYVALASSSKSHVIDFYMTLLNIRDVVDLRTSADEAAKSKPFPDIFAAALRNLGAPADRAIAIGDTPYDAEAAGSLGMRTIGVLCGGFPEGELRGAGAIAIYKDPADLLTHYASSPIAG